MQGRIDGFRGPGLSGSQGPILSPSVEDLLKYKVYISVSTTTSFIASISHTSVPLRTYKKGRAAFCLKLSLIYATVYELLQQNNLKFQ